MRLPRLGRRYRFGWPAALLAGGYTAAVVVAGAAAAAGDDGFLWRLLVPSGGWTGSEMAGWSVLPLVLAGAVQGWALWQILRGPAAGDRVRRAGAVRLLRWTFYADAALYLLVYRFLGFEAPWWVDLSWSLVQLAFVLLFHRVTAGSPGVLRFAVLALGSLTAAASLGAQACEALGLSAAGGVFTSVLLDGMPWTLWTVLVLVSQRRDGRWSRTTVRIGAADLAMTFLVLPLAAGAERSLRGFSSGDLGFMVSAALTLVSHVLTPVWLARSAHDLAGPPVRAVRAVRGEEIAPGAETGSETRAVSSGDGGRGTGAGPRRERPVEVRAPLGRWPLAAAAVVLPALPVLAGLARGVPFWLGPEGPVSGFLGSPALHPLSLLWFYADLLVGAGGLAFLALVAVVRRTRRLMRTAAGVLLLAAVIGAVTVFVPPAGPEATGSGVLVISNVSFGSGGPEAYPDWVFAPGAQQWDRGAFLGISPLWHSAACTVSALILLLRYGRGPARRSPYRTAAVCAVTVAALCLLPAADLARGPFTTEGDCGRLQPTDGYGWRAEAPPLSDELTFVCAVRAAGETLPSWQDLSDPELLAYGRRLCGVYTRNDPGEIARVRAVNGVDVREFTYVIDEVCPAADAVVRAERAEEEREMREWEAEQQRMCDEAPRHRPLIRPASATVVGKPVRTDYGVLEAYEETSDGDPSGDGLLDRAQENGLVAGLPGHLMVRIHSDAPTCLTLETYPRRPPVETRGWQHVVEVGYRSPGGMIELGDPMSGPEYPNLALRGRAGDYRIRVHYAWLPWKGEEHAGPQRLLIMAYPGRGDGVVVHRRRTGP
ncbi:hypothetical protein [Planomonospora parontospora]|uniref:hypothetical protein n=1 Tax=Planomonospora parontospora TaxID=58119 RepID=UPI0016707692|nr:hypothetical protein [Planomonospora parontospora]GGL42117.1 hypothetical protein GCM10014719_49270 [Planomonospora parontospora subsp. antibiotica]GII18332.1 hypothetical protein Ppa05_50580 [Planomonospora parontospora subsp. antibiotica]